MAYRELLEKLHCTEVHGIKKQSTKCTCICTCECGENCKEVCSHVQEVLNVVKKIMEKVGEKDPIFQHVVPCVIGSLRKELDIDALFYKKFTNSFLVKEQRLAVLMKLTLIWL